MGKSKNASFSYVDKSNFQLLKEKFKEKNVNQKLKNDKNGMNCESEKKKKKNFWSKWLTSVRGSWSCGEARPPQEKSQVVATKSLEGSVDLFEIPIDPERKISKLFIEPTKTGLKTVIAEYRGPSSYSEELIPNKRPALRNNFFEMGGVKKNDGKMSQEPLKTHTQSLAKNAKLITDKKEPSQKIEPLLTSALFIHKDIDRMVESAVFMEPNLPRDYAESKLSDEISQKSLRINNVRVSYQGKEKDQIIKTFKTTSEPTWEERKKIIHRQRLKENINYLVKQFVFLEAQDVIDYSRLERNSTGKKGIPFNQSSSGSTSRDLSREVSPEILVNIKPFKEYVSENTVDSQKPMKSPAFAERQDRAPKMRFLGASENEEVENISEKRTCPVLKSTVTFLKKNDSERNEENSFGIEESILTISPAKNDMSATCNRNTSDDLDLETPTFSFWDVCKTYSTCENLLQVEVELGNTSFQLKQNKRGEKIQTDAEAEEEILRNSRSLDEVLDTLEDGDHDLIFQKNMSQFKKKISVKPLLDFRKSTSNTNKKGLGEMEDKVWQKLTRLENPLDTENSIGKKVAEVADFSLENSREKKIEMCRSECLNLQTKVSQNSEKILENIYLNFCESIVVKQVLATRVEAETLSLYQTLREVHDIQENNIVAVIRIENPKNFDETLKKIELFGETPTLLEKSCSVDSKDAETIAMFLCIDQNDLEKNLASNGLEPNGIVGTNRCASEDVQLFSQTKETFLEFPKAQNSCHLNLSSLNFCSKLLELSEEVIIEEDENKAENVEVGVRERSTRTLIQAEADRETRRSVVLILNHPSYEYTLCIYDKKFGSFKLCTKSYSEPDLFKNLANGRRHQSDSAVTDQKKETAKAGLQVVPSGNMRSKNYSNICFHCFHAPYNNGKKSLNDDEEELTMSCRCFPTEILSTGFNAGIKEENQKKEEKKMEQILKETDIPEKSNRVLKHKSNSSPKEAIIQNQLFREKQLMRKSNISLKEVENKFTDLVHRRTKKASAEEIEGTEKVESASMDPENEKVSVRFLEKSSFEESKPARKPFVVKQEGEADKRKMFLVRKSGTNVKKEVVAAINLIKDLNPCKGEDKGKSKQISLVILLSKN